MEIFKNVLENGVLEFLIGVLFILSIFHFLLFFQHRSKSYLFYSLYAFFLFLSISQNAYKTFIFELFGRDWSFFKYHGYFITQSSFVAYFLFVYRFLDIKKHYPRWNSAILKGVYTILGFILFAHLIYLITKDHILRDFAHYFFIIYMVVFAIIAYYPIFKLKDHLKFYIIIGSLLLLIPSVFFPLYVSFASNPSSEIVDLTYGFFYLGIFMENLCFSLGLGHKHKRIVKENRKFHIQIIEKYKENEILKETIQQQLEDNVKSLTALAEKEKLEKLNANYEKEMAELRITALKSQMNPHFIFNSLNSIKLYIIENDKTKAVYYLNKFSKLIRKILASTRSKEISLLEELEIATLYVGIENIRFENQINFEILIGTAINSETIKVPPLILQPFLENAIWHGLPNKVGKKRILLEIQEIPGFIAISLSDNGIGRKQAQQLKDQKIHKKNSLGMKLTKERLKHFSKNYSKPCFLEISDLYPDNLNNVGTLIKLKVPLW